jgi:hypothetical protein
MIGCDVGGPQVMRQLVVGGALSADTLVRSGALKALASLLAPAHLTACAAWPALGRGHHLAHAVAVSIAGTLDTYFQPPLSADASLREYQKVSSCHSCDMLSVAVESFRVAAANVFFNNRVNFLSSCSCKELSSDRDLVFTFL